MNKQIEAMKKLGMSDAEIAELLKADKEIEQGKNLFPLTKDQEKVSKEARSVGREPTVYKLDNAAGKRSKKADNNKQEIMRKLLDCFDEYAPQIINAEREFTFTYNEKKFKITLSAPRT